MHRDDKHRPTPPPAPTPATTPAPTPPPATKPRVNFDPPQISAGGTGEDWKYFLTRWEEYVAATDITGTQRILSLLECCDEELRKDLTRNAGGSLARTPEVDVLQAIKLLAVREENSNIATHQTRKQKCRLLSVCLVDPSRTSYLSSLDVMSPTLPGETLSTGGRKLFEYAT